MCTYQLLEYALVECLFWLPAPVEFLVVLLKTVEMGFPLLATVVAQLVDPVKRHAVIDRVGRCLHGHERRCNEKKGKLSVSTLPTPAAIWTLRPLRAAEMAKLRPECARASSISAAVPPYDILTNRVRISLRGDPP